jgi:hypothetical protein
MVGATLNFASKFTTKAISGLVLFARYISTLITLRYEYSEPKTFFSSSHDRNGSISFSKTITIIGVLDG